MKRSIAALCCLATLSLAGAAQAIHIDFTDPAVGAGANGESVWEYETPEGVIVRLTPGPRGSELYWDEEDGFGVTGGYEHDEIDSKDRLKVTFHDSDGNAIEVLVESFDVSDLFREAANYGRGMYDEVGKYKVDGAAKAKKFTPKKGVTNHDNTNGTGTVAVGESTATLLLSAPGKAGPVKNGVYKKDHEFSLAGITFHIASVPELTGTGAAGALVLLGGLGLVLGGRRRDLGGT